VSRREVEGEMGKDELKGRSGGEVGREVAEKNLRMWLFI